MSIFGRELLHIFIWSILCNTQTREKKPRETLLHAEYVNALGCINAERLEENRLKFLQWDLKQHSRWLSLFSSSHKYLLFLNLNNKKIIHFLQQSYRGVVKAKRIDEVSSGIEWHIPLSSDSKLTIRGLNSTLSRVSFKISTRNNLNIVQPVKTELVVQGCKY